MSQKNLPAGKSYTRKKIQNFSYGLTDTIGKGYSSQVYRGRNDNTQEPVAVKVIDLKMLKCEINRTLLASEIQILKSMKNVPYVLTLHQVYTTKNNTYIITELCQTDLSTKIKKGLSQSESFVYMNQIIQGYSYIYDRSLIHRDLKPANLLITKNNQIKIADFGFGVKAEQVLKPSKYNVGSPLYMAPQSLKRNQYSFKTDIWALGIIFFQMLTGDTPWRAKNQKQLLKKIQGQKINDILPKHKFPQIVSQFLSKSLCQDKNIRLGPQQLIKYVFKIQQFGTILGQKHLNNSIKNQKFQSLVNQASSPKNIGRSIEKRLFYHDKSDKKLQPKVMNSIQNMSLKNIQNLSKPYHPRQVTPTTGVSTETGTAPAPDTMSKQDKKFISKLLIAQVHFCRFLYKLLGRVKQSAGNGGNAGLFRDNIDSDGLFRYFTMIVQRKITNLRNFQTSNYLDISQQRYQEYKRTSDYKKLIKIAKDYYQRYSTELTQNWTSQSPPNSLQTHKQVYENYKQCIAQVTKIIQFLLQNLEQKYQQNENNFNDNRYQSDVDGDSYQQPGQNQFQEMYGDGIDRAVKSKKPIKTAEREREEQHHDTSQKFLKTYNKDIIILDYLITCKQLLQMIQKQMRAVPTPAPNSPNSPNKTNTIYENYQKFAKKSRIEEIVQGSTSQISMDLYFKIMERGRNILNGGVGNGNGNGGGQRM